MIWLILGIILVVFGVRHLYKGSLLKNFYDNVRGGKISEYKKVTGIVICDACYASDLTDLTKPVTPIVEYEVNGEKYETQNPILRTGAELPVGTRVCVWYKKDNPSSAILGTELDNYFSVRLFGFSMIAFGILFILLSI